uniref:ribosomal protein S3 n=1 Tax=Hypnea wynnei TaxID=1867777 RepID=UPI003001F7AE|nr:ribosomal protein S3 [Hypnea wynnei]
MAQKINPTSLRLGISQLWTSNIQFYGKSFKLYFFLFHYCIKSFIFLKRISNSIGFLIHYQQLKIKKYNPIILNIYYTQPFFVLKADSTRFYNKIQNTLSKFFSKKLCIGFYLMGFPLLSSNLLYSYSQFLVFENLTAKRILWNLSKLLEMHLNSLKIIHTSRGVKILKLKGFKIQIAGRIDDSKTQMAKRLNLNVGSSCLTSLQDYIIYSKSILYSKSGTCGVKIWLFYEFVY